MERCDYARFNRYPVFYNDNWTLFVILREAHKPGLTREQTEAWTKPFDESDELVKTARDFHNSVTDPKLKGSQVGNW